MKIQQDIARFFADVIGQTFVYRTRMSGTSRDLQAGRQANEKGGQHDHPSKKVSLNKDYELAASRASIATPMLAASPPNVPVTIRVDSKQGWKARLFAS